MPDASRGTRKEGAGWPNLRALCEDPSFGGQEAACASERRSRATPPRGRGGFAAAAVCRECGRELEAAYRFCPWCAAPQRRKLVEFFRAHPRDAGKALRVSRYLTEDPHVRFSVWSPDGVAEAAVSLEEKEAERLAGFLVAPQPPRRPSPVERVLSYLVRG